MTEIGFKKKSCSQGVYAVSRTVVARGVVDPDHVPGAKTCFSNEYSSEFEEREPVFHEYGIFEEFRWTINSIVGAR